MVYRNHLPDYPYVIPLSSLRNTVIVQAPQIEGGGGER